MAAIERIKQRLVQEWFNLTYLVVDYKDVDWELYFDHAQRLRNSLVNVTAAFDIETTSFECGQAIMYIWQCKIGPYIMLGRTWEDFVAMIERINTCLKRKRLKIFVHNLSYEFQFLAGVLKFADSAVRIIKSRRILSATYKQITFVCSYMLSNMSLERFCESVGAQKKAVGDLDYSVKRYPHTLLSWKECYYCIQDVVCLCDAIEKQNKLMGDNLSTMPATSTGYVRRDCRKALREAKDYNYQDSKPHDALLAKLRNAFRGGNCHANRLYVGLELENVGSYDIGSAYPSAMLQPYFPTGCQKTVYKRGGMDMKKKLEKLLPKYCCLFTVKMQNVKLKRYEEPIPYLAVHKCQPIVRGSYENGRVLEAESLTASFTEFDWEIVCRQYDFDYDIDGEIYYWAKGYLPESYIRVVEDYYSAKTMLKTGDPYMYGKSKNKLNALYGMLVQNPAGDVIEWLEDDYVLQDMTLQESLDAYEKRAVMDYQKGVWVTAICRWYLQKAIDIADSQTVYSDTDSIKFIGELDLSALRLPKFFSAVDANGKHHPMGNFEFEGRVDKFVTWGAKKYACEVDGEIKLTVAGVNKKTGGKELMRKGGLAAFKPGFIWKAAGGNELIYNDKPEVNAIIADGNVYHFTRNVAFYSSTYTLQITPDYAKKIREIQNKSLTMLA